MSRRLVFVSSWIVLGLLAGFVAATAGDDAPAASAAAQATEAPTPSVGRVSVANGATITWNLKTQRYEPPTAAQQVAISEAMRQLFVEKAGGLMLPFAEKAEVEVLPNGMKRIGPTAAVVNFSLARVGADGELESTCVDGQAAASEILATAPEAKGAER